MEERPEYPRFVAKDANGEFFLDRRQGGVLELLTRKPGGQELRLVLSEVGRNELIDFISTANRQLEAWRCASSFTMQLDRLALRIEWSEGDITLSRASAQQLANALRFG